MGLGRTKPQPPPDGKPQMVRPFLLQPHMTRVVVGKLDDHGALVLGKRRGNLFDQPLLTFDVNGRKQLVLVDRLQQLFVFVLALFFHVGKRRDVPLLVVEIELLRALLGELEEFF